MISPHDYMFYTPLLPEVAWDRVVLTPGSVTRLFDIPGLAEHARGLKTPAEALYSRDQLLTQIELAERDTDPRVADARRTVVVVCASYAARNSRPNSASWPTKQRPGATSTPRRSGSCCSTPPTR